MASSTINPGRISEKSNYLIPSSATLDHKLKELSRQFKDGKNDAGLAIFRTLPILIQNCIYGKLWMVMGSPSEATHPNIACFDFGKVAMYDEHSSVKATSAEKGQAVDDYLSGPQDEAQFVSLTLEQKLQKIIQLFKAGNNGTALLFLRELPSSSQKKIQGKIWEVLGSPTPVSHPDIAREDFGKVALFDEHPGKKATTDDKARAMEAYLSSAHIELEFDQLAAKVPENAQHLKDPHFSCNNPKNKNLTRTFLSYGQTLVNFCYENTLIKLSHGGFIHASSVLGDKYILTQCPLKTTIEDYWRMNVERRASVVVMLNELHENEVFAYWPDDIDGEVIFGKAKVKLLDRKDTIVHEKNRKTSHITLRVLKISIDGMADYTVPHLHHQNWPDHTICGTKGAIELTKQTKGFQNQHGGPVVLHCQAGVGRTGVETVLCENYDNARAGRPYNVQKTVDSLRSPLTGRHPHIVANEKQYNFTHRVLDAIRREGQSEKAPSKPLHAQIAEVAFRTEPLSTDGKLLNIASLLEKEKEIDAQALFKQLPDSLKGKVYANVWELNGKPKEVDFGKKAFHLLSVSASNPKKRIQALKNLVSDKNAAVQKEFVLTVKHKLDSVQYAIDPKAIQAAFTATPFSPKQLIAALKADPVLAKLFTALPNYTGAGTMEEHCIKVMRLFETYFSDEKFPAPFDRNLFRLFLALHDMAKTGMLFNKRSDKSIHREHEATIQIMDSILYSLGYKKEHAAWFHWLVAGDPIGEYMQDEDKFLQFSDHMEKASAALSVTTTEYFQTHFCFYLCDAGSYTVKAGSAKALDAFFTFDDDKPSIYLAGSYALKLESITKFLES